MIPINELEMLYESNKIENQRDAQSFFDAIYAWEYMREAKVMTIEVILGTHKLLMVNQPINPCEKGYFRKLSVWIGGIRKPFLHEQLFREKLQNLCDRMNAPDRDEPGINRAWARNAHIEFEDIHPFIDGNGRVGRMLYNWHLLKMGLPIHVIHEGKEQEEYYRWFKQPVKDWLDVGENHLAAKSYP